MASFWDEGDIAEAVTKAKKQGAIFLVFVEGNNELSSEYRELFINEASLAKLNTEHFVAIKIQENSIPHQQFSAIYPHSSVPSIYFIGKNGKPLDILTSNISLKDFQNYIDTILDKGGIIIQKDSISAGLINSEKQSDISSNNVPTTSASVPASVDVNQTPLAESQELSPEKKLQHARELIEQRKLEKRRQDEEDERVKEIERRKMGQNVQQMKKWQQEEELKQLKEKRDREKKENQAARDRVLAQIAQDKAERAARFPTKSSAPAPMPQSSSQSMRTTPRSNTTRLQFRMPNGSVHTHEFKVTDLLETVHQYIQNEMNLPFSNYTISTTFPRIEFTTNDNSQSLLDLQLVPNAVILILPQNQGVVPSSSGSIVGNVFWWLLAPLFSIYEVLIGYFFGRPSPPPLPPGSLTNTSIKRPASDVEETNRNVPKRQAGSTEIKRQGNIHRLSDRQDTDDDNNTWNGNSTQQM